MSMELKIIIASTRPGRVGLPIGKWFYQFAKEHSDFAVELIDLAEVNLPLFDEPNHPRLRNYTKEHTKTWSAKIMEADAFVFVTPEYNYAMPATLKNAIDYLSFEWQYKPVGFVSYGGISGGVRAVQMEKEVVTTLSMMPLPEGVTIPSVSTHIRDNHEFESSEKIDSSAQEMLAKLILWAKHLKNLREEIRG